ncbi:PREDICTED: synaptonemal complex central element protein 2 [Sturnus vulgaris]|uniref:synaptonemal complex central element protein 2 n=1 Tax=Sturnus vulgaris TaxID=9172 RepID=UPI00071A9F01|nr:PREDICTED: synaptonemal complex central element protein 2 [Sturnus vulgaris]
MSREEPESPEPEAAAGDGPISEELSGDESHGKDPDRCTPLTERPTFWPRPCEEPVLGHRSSLYFASLDATMEGLQRRARDICSRLAESRQEDQTVLSGFRESFLLKVSELTEQLEEQLFHSYGFHNKLIQQRLQELDEVMERVEEVQAELRCICCAVEAAYQDLCLQPEA